MEVNRIRAGSLQYNLQECPIKTIIDRVIDNFKFNYPDRKLILSNHLLANKNIVIGDYDRLMQALINLLDNAAKYSPSDTEISLTLKSDDSNFIIQIRDQGQGIARKDLPKVFERYYRKENSSQGGFGLGLFIVKNIIEYHHGTVRLHSHVNQGTTVEVKLPRAKI